MTYFKKSHKHLDQGDYRLDRRRFRNHKATYLESLGSGHFDIQESGEETQDGLFVRGDMSRRGPNSGPVQSE